MKPMFSAGHATCCTILSIFGVIFLGTMAFLFSLPAESLTHTTNDPDNPADVARACLTATAFYGFMILFCGCQSWLNKREERAQIQLQ
ncbi:ribonuclease kappa [Entomortierella parvispora]|uniref:Ribonuclease kappa n=1 Tax=Entomortierella parvispora TaxID=205924 RepID=A0A9P3HKZ0_9FUNG|nr:ribonuclease kappa [Entomortierella parvispora]